MFSAGVKAAVVAFGVEKLAAKIRVLHGTNGPWPVLDPNASDKVLESDPNPKGLYLASDLRRTRPGVEAFARSAVVAHGGAPVVAHASIDTRKGWAPFNLTLWGKKHLGEVQDARDLVEELDSLEGDDEKARAARGVIWKQLNKGVGTWTHPSNEVPVRVKWYDPVKDRL